MKYNMRDEKGRFCKKEESIIKGYKGFGKGLVCRGKQYKEGEIYEEDGRNICEKGMMHFCESPLDVLEYYPAVNPDTGKPNEYAEVEAIGKVIRFGNKSATNKLRIVRRISLAELIKATATVGCYSNIATVKDHSHAATTGKYTHAVTAGYASNAVTAEHWSNAITTRNWSRAATTGNCSPTVTAGCYSHAVTAGCGSNIVTTGECSRAATVGDHSDAATTGEYSRAATVGDFSHVTTVGHKSHAMTAGDHSQTTASGYFSIAAALGRNSEAKAALGGWIVLAEYDYEGRPLLVKAARVDGKEIKPDTFYRLVNGKFVRA